MSASPNVRRYVEGPVTGEAPNRLGGSKPESVPSYALRQRSRISNRRVIKLASPGRRGSPTPAAATYALGSSLSSWLCQQEYPDVSRWGG